VHFGSIYRSLPPNKHQLIDMWYGYMSKSLFVSSLQAVIAITAFFGERSLQPVFTHTICKKGNYKTSIWVVLFSHL
jgi:hypothetical protein